uniref:6-cysteine protein n=1 Tax=Parastrongyloides trichosuri TaxID=131310 RepID=A0A0N4ZMZ6_PARTI
MNSLLTVLFMFLWKTLPWLMVIGGVNSYYPRLGNYVCQDRNNQDERFVILDGKDPIDENLAESFFRRHKLSDTSRHDKDITIQLGEGKTLTVKNVNIIKIILKDLFVPEGRNNYVKLYTFLNFLFCPIRKIENKIYFFDSIKIEDNGLRKYDQTTRCTVEYCNIGLYLYEENTEVGTLLKGGTINKAFYVAIVPEKNEEFFSFYGLKFTVNVKALLKCPYKEWFHKHSSATFEPMEYITDEFPGVGNRHKYVPGYAERNLEKIHQDQNSKGFICGRVRQLKPLPTFNVGFEYGMNNDIIKSTNVRFDNGILFCGSNDLKDYYVFGYLSKRYQLIEGPEWKYFKDNIKLHYGQLLYAYKKSDVDERYNNFDANKAIPPSCIGENKELPATLKLNINGSPVSEFKSVVEEDGTYVFYYMIDEIKGTEVKLLSCYANLDNHKNDAFNEYYAKNYRFNIIMKKTIDKRIVSTPSEFEKSINKDNDFYGIYACKTTSQTPNKMLKESNIVIVPANNQVLRLIKKIVQAKAEELRCMKEDIEGNKLIQMDVTIPTQKVIKFFIKDKKKTNFDEAILYYYYIPDNKIKYQNETKLKCHYGNETRKIFIEITHDVNEGPPKNFPTSDDKLLLYVAGSLGITGLILIIIGAVVAILIKKKRKKRRLKELSLSKSGLSGGLNKSSTSKSKSLMTASSKRSSSKSIPNSKSMKTTSSTSKSKNNLNNIKITANIKTKSKSGSKISKIH